MLVIESIPFVYLALKLQANYASVMLMLNGMFTILCADALEYLRLICAWYFLCRIARPSSQWCAWRLSNK